MAGAIHTLYYANGADLTHVATGQNGDGQVTTWSLQNYRNLKFYSPTTGDLNTWLQSNAVKMPLEGTWVFNSSFIDFPTTTVIADVNFSCNDVNYTRLKLVAGDTPTIGYLTNSSDKGVVAYQNGSWTNTAYRTITFTSPVQYEGNEEFVRWFVDNAAPPPVT